jgi:hypothetical protein
MPQSTSQPETVPKEAKQPSYEELLAENAQLRELVHQLKEQIQILRDEIAVLKKQKPKPQISPSKLMEKKKKKTRKKRKRKKAEPRQIDETKVVKAENVPEGSRFKGYDDFYVQELVIKATTTRYRKEKWLTPDGELITAKMDVESDMPHFGPTLCSFVLYQYYHAQVTEPLILEQLREWGVKISSGHLHRMITEGKEKYHREKDEILKVGLRVSGHIHVDDTGGRHKGKNGYCTHIGNEWFAWFESTESKSRINFLELLRAGHTDYVLSGEGLEYMAVQKLPKEQLKKLAAEVERRFPDKATWEAFLEQKEIKVDRHVRIATEGALLGSVLSHEINPNLVIVSDDAGQFNVLLHALCWIHAERILAKLIGFSAAQRIALKKVRTSIWKLYRDIKAYQKEPTSEVKAKLEQRFDEICNTPTCFTTLNRALERMHKNKAELLLALERPDLPLHNNLSEGDIREHVKRRKISGGTRSEEGRRCRDTFSSLKKTCRKLKVSFWKFLNDRVRGQNQIPALPTLIEAKAAGT